MYNTTTDVGVDFLLVSKVYSGVSHFSRRANNPDINESIEKKKCVFLPRDVMAKVLY